MSKYCNFIIKGSIGDVLSYMVLLRDNDIPGIVLSNKAALSFSSQIRMYKAACHIPIFKNNKTFFERYTTKRLVKIREDDFVIARMLVTQLRVSSSKKEKMTNMFVITSGIGSNVLSFYETLRKLKIPFVVISHYGSNSSKGEIKHMHAMPPRMLTDSTHASKVIIRTSDFSMVEALAKDIELHVI